MNHRAPILNMDICSTYWTSSHSQKLLLCFIVFLGIAAALDNSTVIHLTANGTVTVHDDQDLTDMQNETHNLLVFNQSLNHRENLTSIADWPDADGTATNSPYNSTIFTIEAQPYTTLFSETYGNGTSINNEDANMTESVFGNDTTTIDELYIIDGENINVTSWPRKNISQEMTTSPEHPLSTATLEATYTEVFSEDVGLSPVDTLTASVRNKDFETTTRTITDTTSSSVTEDQDSVSSESNDAPGYIWFVLIMDGNCSINNGDLDQLKDKVEEEMEKWFEIGRRDVAVYNTSCSSSDQMHVNITMFRKPGANISRLLTSLEDLGHPLVRVKHHDYYVYKILTTDGYISKEPDIPVDMKHSDVELVIYVAVGSTCLFLIFLVIGLLSCKYWNCRDQKPFDFGDAPNLNMHLEDYTLTRIPRPKLGYVDYYKGLTKRYSPLDDKIVTSHSGMVQPFDTSVVPLEDAHALDAARSAPPASTFRDYRDGVIVRPSEIHRFGQSLSRIYRSSRERFTGRQADNCYENRSTEHLHQPNTEDKAIDRGLDNPVYY